MRALVFWFFVLLLLFESYSVREAVVGVLLLLPLFFILSLLLALCYGLGDTMESLFYFVKSLLSRKEA